MIDPFILSEIESTALAVELNVVSSLRQFERAVVCDVRVNRLFESLDTNGDFEELTRRTTSLLDRETDPLFENPHDVSIAVYLRILDVRKPELASLVAGQVVKAGNLWWARKIANRILTESLVKTATLTAELMSGESEYPNVDSTSAATNTFPTLRLPARLIRITVGKGAVTDEPYYDNRHFSAHAMESGSMSLIH